MAIICPHCGHEFDATLFQFGHRVRCVCGKLLSEPSHTLRLEREAREEGPPDSSSGKEAKKRP